MRGSMAADCDGEAAGAPASAEKPVHKPLVPVICVVPGCTTDVSGGPHYLKRHKICQVHLKAKEVSIDGRSVRFCQQCGRFQLLADFKDNQRSCEAALQAHNARRRVKKDGQGNVWSSERRGRGAKRSLPAACATDDPSSSEDGATGAPRKSAAARKSSSQRSAPSALQTSAGGSDSFEGSKGHDRPLSDGARTIEQNAWTSHASPDNSFGSPEGFEQQHHLDEGQVLHMLPDGSYQHGAAGPSRLAMHSGTSGSTDAGWSAGCSALTGLLYQLPQDLGMGAQPALSQAQQMMSGPTLSCNPSTGFGGYISPPGTLEAWMLPQGVMQQQQAQLQQYWAPSGVAGSGLQEAMGQSVMLQQAMQQQQLMMMSQPQLQHQPSMQMQMQHNMLLPQQQQQQPKQDPLQQKLQQLSGSGTGSVKNGKASAATESSGTLFTGQAVSGASARTASVEPSATGPQACMPAAGSQDKAAEQGPATSAAAAAMLAKEPMFGLLPIQGANSSSSLSLLDGLDTSARGPPALDDVQGSATFDEDSLLEHALDVLLASGPDWQMDDVLLGPSAAAVRSGTNSAAVPHATTSSPSSSNINGANNLSGPLSVPSLPSASARQFSAQQAACGMAAATAGLVSATDALRVGSPNKGPAAIMPAAAGSMLAAAGDGVGLSALMEDLLPPIHFSAGTAVAGMDASVPVPAGAAGRVGPAAGSFGSASGGVFPAAAGCAQVSSMISASGMFPGSSSAAAGMFGSAGGVPGGAAALGGGLQPTAGGAAPGAMSAALAMTGLGLGSGDLAMGMSSAVPLTHTTGARVSMQQPGGGFSQLDHVYTGLPGPSVQAMWQHQQQQQQQQQESLLLQQQLMMQQQQQAEYLLLQQQQQMQRRQQLMRLQQQINSTITYSQQLVRLSMKLHGVPPDLLPASTVLAMERLLVNNAADMEMILLQPSLRQGCIQFEFDIIVKCPLPTTGQQGDDSCLLSAHEGDTAAGTQAAAEGDDQPRMQAPGAAPAEEGGMQASSSSLDNFELGSSSKWYLGSEIPAIVSALNNDAATQAGEARLRAALPFQQLVEALLDLPLLDGAAAAAAGDDSDDGSSGSDADSDSASSAGSSAGATVRSCAQAIYAQVGNCLGMWRADSGLVQEWNTEMSSELTFGGGAVGGNWRPSIGSCMPLVAAVAESSAANSPTAAAAAGEAHVLKPLPLRLELQAAPGGSSAAAASNHSKLKLWCTRRGQFLPLATRAAPAGTAPGPLGSADLLDLQMVAGLLDSTPGLLLLQVEQQVQVQAAAAAALAASTRQDQLPAEAQEMGCMSSLIPVLLCPSAAMAAECHVHLCMMEDAVQVAPKMLELGLVLDFWAMHQQLQQPRYLDSSPQAAWQEALLGNRQYLKVIKSLGTRLLLTAVVSGMSATSAHLHAIMLVVRDLLASTQAPAPAARAAAAAAAAPGAADVPAADTEAADGGEEADEDASHSNSSSSSVLQEGVSAAVTGLKPVEECVFEDVDCKGAAAGELDCRSPSSSSSNSGLSKPSDGKPAAGPAGGVPGGHASAVRDSGSHQQSPYVIFRGATQMLGMLLVMYLLLEVLAAVYKGRSPAQQLLESLTQLKELLGIMLVPLAMMCFGGVLAVWQFGLNGPSQAAERREQQQRAASMTANAPASKAAAGKAAGLQEEGVAWT